MILRVAGSYSKLTLLRTLQDTVSIGLGIRERRKPRKLRKYNMLMTINIMSIQKISNSGIVLYEKSGSFIYLSNKHDKIIGIYKLRN